MAKAMVKCPYCEQSFDRLSVPNIKVGRRYAHVECYNKHEQNMTQEEKEEQELYEYVKQLYGKDYNYILVKRQIEKFSKQGYSYKGMRLSLKWFYEVQHHSIENSNGIGIIPYVFDDAKEYYYRLYLAQVANSNIKNYKPKQQIITIPSPRTYVRPPHLWDLDKEETSEGDV